MSVFEESLREGIAVLGEANAAFAAHPEEGIQRKNNVAYHLVGLIRANLEHLPLTGFAQEVAYNTEHGTTHVPLTDERLDLEAFPIISAEDEEEKYGPVLGAWLQPDMYLIGGDSISRGSHGYMTNLGVMPRGVYSEVRRFKVILDTLSIATPEEVAPAVAEREKNDAKFQASWSRHLESQRVELEALS